MRGVRHRAGTNVISYAVLEERGVTYEPGLGVKLFVAYSVFSFGCGPHHQRVKLREWRCWFFRLEIVLVVVELVGAGAHEP